MQRYKDRKIGGLVQDPEGHWYWRKEIDDRISELKADAEDLRNNLAESEMQIESIWRVGARNDERRIAELEADLKETQEMEKIHITELHDEITKLRGCVEAAVFNLEVLAEDDIDAPMSHAARMAMTRCALDAIAEEK